MTTVYQAYIKLNRCNLYGERLIKLPAPQYIIFYNGEKEQPDSQILKLSDAFDGVDSCLECKAVMYNINYGHNMELLEQCRTLEEYSLFVNCIRKYSHKGYPLKQAIELGVNECIEKNILSEFLIKNRSEVIQVLLMEYNAKEHIKMERRDAYADGMEQGVELRAEQTKIENAINLLDILSVEEISERIGLPLEKVMCLHEAQHYKTDRKQEKKEI